MHVVGPSCFAKTASGEKKKLLHLRQVVSSNDCTSTGKNCESHAIKTVSFRIVDSTIVENTMRQKIVNCTFTLSSIQELHTLSEIQDDIGNIVIVYTRDCETMASARMYVLYTHRAVVGASVHVLVSMLVKLACETAVGENCSCCLSSKAQHCRDDC